MLRGSSGVSAAVAGGYWSGLEAPDPAWCRQWCEYPCVWVDLGFIGQRFCNQLTLETGFQI